MKETALKKMGFKKIKVSAKESGDKPFYYYTWDPYEGSNFSLITQSNDEIEINDGWIAQVFDDPRISFSKAKDVKKLIKCVTHNIVDSK